MNDNINHPSHYTRGKYEAIDVIEDWNLDFCLGSAVKYIARAGYKDDAKTEEDLRKAVWYIERFIKQRKATVGPQGCGMAQFITHGQQMKEKEAKCYYDSKNDTIYYKCSDCGTRIEADGMVKYCFECGCELKLEG